MPLDMLTTRLADIAAWHGITPVPLEVLEAHKIAEVKKRPGHWLYPHESLANCLFGAVVCLSFGAAVASCALLVTGALAQQETLIWTSVASIVVSLLAMYWVVRTGAMSNGVRLYGPAVWSETEVPLQYVPAPAAIKAIAARIMQHDMGDMRLIQGRLLQDFIVVDPYLLIERGGERIVIGIWDDNGVIQQATV